MHEHWGMVMHWQRNEEILERIFMDARKHQWTIRNGHGCVRAAMNRNECMQILVHCHELLGAVMNVYYTRCLMWLFLLLIKQQVRILLRDLVDTMTTVSNVLLNGKVSIAIQHMTVVCRTQLSDNRVIEFIPGVSFRTIAGWCIMWMCTIGWWIVSLIRTVAWCRSINHWNGPHGAYSALTFCTTGIS